MQSLFISLLIGLLVGSSVAAPVSLATRSAAKPTPQQQQWLDYEVASMITWNIQTICSHGDGGKPYTTNDNVTSTPCQVSSSGFVPANAAVNAWNPSSLNTDEWASVSASFGAKYVILVAQHWSGFSLWDTQQTNYSIAHTSYSKSQDVVKEMIASCNKYNLTLGIFYSVHMNWYAGVTNGAVNADPIGPTNYTQQSFVDMAGAQIKEIADLFDGNLFELWFDAGVDNDLHLKYGLGDAIRAAAPNAICHGCLETDGGPIRWMMNEIGVQALPSWGALNSTREDSSTLADANGDPMGAVFNPPVCDTVLREHDWFYVNKSASETDNLRSNFDLVNVWLTSVGRSANLILNIGPNGLGAIEEEDVAAYKRLGKSVECLLKSEVGGEGEGVYKMDADSGVMEPPLSFDSPITGNYTFFVREDISHGQLINSFEIHCKIGGENEWDICPLSELGEGVIEGYPLSVGIGHKRVFHLVTGVGVEIEGVRVVVKDHYATESEVPTLRDIVFYDWNDVADCV